MLEAEYNLLCVERNASPEDVRKAYVRLVRRYPPEHFPEKFAKLHDAYQKLILNDDFLTAQIKRVRNISSPLEMAAFLWGDRRELIHDPHFDPNELKSFFVGEETRSNLDELLDMETEIEWKIGGIV
jgi:curved DNA-binding protein CbpA